MDTKKISKPFPLLYRLVYGTVRALVAPTLKKYTFTTDRVPELDEPYLMVSNHTTERDMWMTGRASRQPMYFVCGEHLLRNRLYGKALRTLADPIPMPKGSAGTSAIKEMVRRLKAGKNVMLFPEGKRSYHGRTIPAPVSLGKLVKMADCALVTYRIRGGFFVQPRWSRVRQKGHVEGSVTGVWTREQLRDLTAQQITDLINEGIYENAYDTQREKMWTYRGERRAEGMEKYLFYCPRCRRFDTMAAASDTIYCTNCSLQARFDEYGFLRSEKLPFDDILRWGELTREEFDEYVDSTPGDRVLFTEPEVTLYRMREDYTNEDLLTGDLLLYEDRMELDDRIFPFNEIRDLSVLFGDILLFTCDGTYYGMRGDRFHAWKGGRLWHRMRGDTDDPSKEI